MTSDNNRELRKVLEMVEAGRISSEEAEKLLGAIHPDESTTTCPWCAESIPAGVATCPECRSPLQGQDPYAPVDNAGGSVGSLDGMSKFLMIYTFVISLIALLSNFMHLASPRGVQGLLACLGLVSAVLIFKRNRLGWTVGAIWAALQILSPIVFRVPLTRQVFHIGFNTMTNGSGIGFNIVGIILLILFIRAGRRQP